ncbi:MAG: rhomboid family intramembrane serine protease [Clostridiales bacterium]|nr:rhomboid family intramembrane serine protease [Clostridiales bacterium]
MNKFTMIINNNRKDLKWWQHNWVFATTVFFVLLCIIIHSTQGDLGIDIDFNNHWHDCLYFKGLLRVFLSSFFHANWQHVLLNMLCFFICGIYLERKIGSIYFLLLILAFSLFGNSAVSANHGSLWFRGFSGVNYAIYAYILVDYLFCVIPKTKRNKLNIIYGGVMLGLIYFAACFNGGTQKVSFSWYPYDAMHNLAHYTSYFAGLIIATVLCTFRYLLEKKQNSENKEIINN